MTNTTRLEIETILQNLLLEYYHPTQSKMYGPSRCLEAALNAVMHYIPEESSNAELIIDGDSIPINKMHNPVAAESTGGCWCELCEVQRGHIKTGYSQFPDSSVK